ncbi:unnamed protein product [Trichogramma brassicae]|uniref:Uncharacterized protein n=1 Tax=Trichogramma brassicae TaxID=86971 RepID=A0A6H5I1X7_9HYME|nr:unnamed protein product [Trichogramma brassicae]
MDCLLMNDLYVDRPVNETTLIDIMILIGYEDATKKDEKDMVLPRRVTPIHVLGQQDRKLGRTNIQNITNIPKLFKIYNRFDVNYTDEDGFTHFHAASMLRLLLYRAKVSQSRPRSQLHRAGNTLYAASLFCDVRESRGDRTAPEKRRESEFGRCGWIDASPYYLQFVHLRCKKRQDVDPNERQKISAGASRRPRRVGAKMNQEAGRTLTHSQFLKLGTYIVNFYVNSTTKVGVENLTLEHFEPRLQLLESYWEKAMQKHEALLPYETYQRPRAILKTITTWPLRARYTENKSLLQRRITELRRGQGAVGSAPALQVDSRRYDYGALPPSPACLYRRSRGSRINGRASNRDSARWSATRSQFRESQSWQHLLNAVQGPAALRLRGLEIRRVELRRCLGQLLRRYDNRNIRLFNALEHLIELPRVKVRCTEDLTDLIDRAEEAVRSFDGAAMPGEVYDTLDCPMRREEN